MQMIPMVAAVPNAVPKSMDIMVQSKKVARIKTEGEIREAEILTISGMVPDARHAALIAPTTVNSAMIVLTSQTDSKAAKRSFFAEILRESPYPKKRKKPMVKIDVRGKDRAVPTMSITAKALSTISSTMHPLQTNFLCK